MKKQVEGLLASIGNRKLGRDTIILNITSATDCPSRARGLCQLYEPSLCYALHAERIYSGVLNFRRAQTIQWDHMSTLDMAKPIIRAALDKRRTIPIKYLRFSESGDFRTQEDIEKMNELARILAIEAGITTYGYTARIDLDLTMSPYLVVTGSGFMADNEFRVVRSPTGNHPLCSRHCLHCSLCKRKKGLVIETTLHGRFSWKKIAESPRSYSELARHLG